MSTTYSHQNTLKHYNKLIWLHWFKIQCTSHKSSIKHNDLTIVIKMRVHLPKNVGKTARFNIKL